MPPFNDLTFKRSSPDFPLGWLIWCKIGGWNTDLVLTHLINIDFILTPKTIRSNYSWNSFRIYYLTAGLLACVADLEIRGFLGDSDSEDLPEILPSYNDFDLETLDPLNRRFDILADLDRARDLSLIFSKRLQNIIQLIFCYINNE